MSENTKVGINHIILPFDFSNSSKNALLHAISIAEKLNANLTLLSVMDPHSSQYLQYKGNIFAEFEGLAKEKLSEFTKQVVTLSKIEYIVYEASWSRAVADLVKKHKGSLVVLSYGDKSRDGYFSGFHAYRIVDSLHIPILVVKEAQQVTDYKIIISPLDGTRHTREKLPLVTIMGKAFEAKVLVIGLQTSNNSEATTHLQSIMNQASKYVKLKVRQYESKLVPTKNVVTEMLNGLSEDHADLLIIMSSHEKSLAHPFSGSYAQQITDKANTPVLLCPVTLSGLISSVSV